MSAELPYDRVVRQAAHDAVRAVLAEPAASQAGSAALRETMTWLLAEYGADAWRDVAEELAVDLAEAIDAIAAVEHRDPLAVLDAWFHDDPVPPVPDPTRRAAEDEPTTGPDGGHGADPERREADG